VHLEFFGAVAREVGDVDDIRDDDSVGNSSTMRL
jgi:hypothetical protein